MVKMDLVVRGKEVEVTWEEPLQANTTYVWQFGQGIVDVNEGNAAKGLVHAFATGPELDTLSIAGRVVDALDGTGRFGHACHVVPGRSCLGQRCGGENAPVCGMLLMVTGRFRGGVFAGGHVSSTGLERRKSKSCLESGRAARLGACVGDRRRQHSSFDEGRQQRPLQGPRTSPKLCEILWGLRVGN